MAENFVNIIRDIRGSTNDPATDTSCIMVTLKVCIKNIRDLNRLLMKKD